MRILRWAHTVYGLLIFCLLFFVFFFLFLIPILFPGQWRLTANFNRWWARMLFLLIGIPTKIEYHTALDKKQPYIFCPNHFSYLDIPTMGLNTCDAIFVGKNDMERIPLFGFMYKRLHITVDRGKLKSRYSTLVQSMHAIDEGKSLIIYAEGGIMSAHPPAMARFKDGAFRIAIEKQIPLVPVTIPYNWIILPDKPQLLLRWHKIHVIYHHPIETKGMTLDQVEELKEKAFSIIDTELKRWK